MREQTPIALAETDCYTSVELGDPIDPEVVDSGSHDSAEEVAVVEHPTAAAVAGDAPGKIAPECSTELVDKKAQYSLRHSFAGIEEGRVGEDQEVIDIELEGVESRAGIVDHPQSAARSNS